MSSSSSSDGALPATLMRSMLGRFVAKLGSRHASGGGDGRAEKPSSSAALPTTPNLLSAACGRADPNLRHSEVFVSS